MEGYRYHPVERPTADIQRDRDELFMKLPELEETRLDAVLSAARRNDADLHAALGRRISNDLDLFPITDAVAEALLDAGQHRALVSNLDSMPHPTAELARRLLAEGEGWAALAYASRFPAGTFDAAYVDVVARTRPEFAAICARVRSDIGDPDSIERAVRRHRVGLLNEALGDLFDHANSDTGIGVPTAAHVSRGLEAAIPDAALFRELANEKGVESARFSFAMLDRARDLGWARPERFSDIADELFRMDEKTFFSEDAIASFLSTWGDGLSPDRFDGETYEAFVHRWVTDLTLRVNESVMRDGMAHSMNQLAKWDQLSPEERKDAKDRFLNGCELLSKFLHCEDSALLDAYAPIAMDLLSDPNIAFPLSGEAASQFYDVRVARVYAAFADRISDDVAIDLFQRYLRTVGRDESTRVQPTRGADTSWPLPQMRVLVEALFRNVSVSNAEVVFEKALETFGTHPDASRLRSIFGAMLASPNEGIRAAGVARARAAGYPVTNEQAATWLDCGPQNTAVFRAARELAQWRELEYQRPGITTVLRGEFGIENAARYPLPLLIDQYDKRDDVSMPYGIVVNPKTDYNAAFSDRDGHESVVSDLVKALDGKFRVRVYEASNERGLLRALIRARDRYGRRGAGKIAFALIGGHGSENSIQFGEQPKAKMLSGRLTQSMLEGSAARRVGEEFFEPDATVVLRSCSTGKAGGIAKRLSGVLGLRVIAPDADTNIRSLSARVDPAGRPEISVEFFDGETTAYRAGSREV